VIIDLI